MLVFGTVLGVTSKTGSAGDTIGFLIFLASIISLIILLVKSVIEAIKKAFQSTKKVSKDKSIKAQRVKSENHNEKKREIASQREAYSVAFHQHCYKWSEWKHIEGSAPPSHSRLGTCSCGDTKQEQCKCVVSVTDHRDATETEYGYRVYTCPACGFSFNEILPMRAVDQFPLKKNEREEKLNLIQNIQEEVLHNGQNAKFHQHSYKWSEWRHIEGSAPPSHYRIGTCSCGDTVCEQCNCVVSVVNHRDATKTEYGYRVYICSDCGFSFNEIIPLRVTDQQPFSKNERDKEQTFTKDTQEKRSNSRQYADVVIDYANTNEKENSNNNENNNITQENKSHTGISKKANPSRTIRGSTSFKEQVIYYYIHKVYSDAISRYKCSDVGELDIYIPCINAGIEYDGSYWHKDKIEQDNTKNLRANEKGIRLIRIRVDELPRTDNAFGEIRVRHTSSYDSDVISLNHIFRKLGDILQDDRIKSIKISYSEYLDDLPLIYSNIFNYYVEPNLSDMCGIELWDKKCNGALSPECIPKNGWAYAILNCKNNQRKVLPRYFRDYKKECEEERPGGCKNCISYWVCPLLLWCKEKDYLNNQIYDCEYVESQVRKMIKKGVNHNKLEKSYRLTQWLWLKSNLGIKLIKEFLSLSDEEERNKYLKFFGFQYKEKPEIGMISGMTIHVRTKEEIEIINEFASQLRYCKLQAEIAPSLRGSYREPTVDNPNLDEEIEEAMFMLRHQG